MKTDQYSPHKSQPNFAFLPLYIIQYDHHVIKSELLSTVCFHIMSPQMFCLR